MKKLLALAVAACAALAVVPVAAASPPAPNVAIAAMVIDRNDVANVAAPAPVAGVAYRTALAVYDVGKTSLSPMPMCAPSTGYAALAAADHRAPQEVARFGAFKV